jgi:hypothetical protein
LRREPPETALLVTDKLCEEYIFVFVLVTRSSRLVRKRSHGVQHVRKSCRDRRMRGVFSGWRIRESPARNRGCDM